MVRFTHTTRLNEETRQCTEFGQTARANAVNVT